jgi:hypothetical protein
LEAEIEAIIAWKLEGNEKHAVLKAQEVADKV